MSIDGAPKNTTASWTQGFLDYSFDIITRDGDGNGSDDEALALGLAWERELDGKARARIEGYKIDAPTLRGETGIAELSLILTPLPSKPLTLDISLQSHTGKREGITGSFRVNYRF
jgi:hypothetical protein